MRVDEDGFLALEVNGGGDPGAGAEAVMAFAKATLRCARTVAMPHDGRPTQVVGVTSVGEGRA